MPTYNISTISLVTMISLVFPGLLYSPHAAAGETEYRIIPYLWTAGIDAEIGGPRLTTDVDVDFGDYIEFVDAGAAFVFEALGEQWSFSGNVMYVELSEDIDLPRTTLDFENTQLLVELAGGYRPQAWKEGRILGGVRYTDMDTTIEFVNGLEAQVVGDWADPFIGLEWRPRRGKWEYLIEGDIGGGVDADFTWQFFAAATRHFSERYALTAGYRILDMDFSDDEFVFDGTLEGIQIGLIFKF